MLVNNERSGIAVRRRSTVIAHVFIFIISACRRLAAGSRPEPTPDPRCSRCSLRIGGAFLAPLTDESHHDQSSSPIKRRQ